MNADAPWPRLGCGAAIVDNGKILLIRRRREPEAGCWGLPGGKVDPFEGLEDAVVREIGEELGIVVRPGGLLCLVDHIDREKGRHWVSPVFRVDRYEGEPAILEPEALSALGWFDLDALPAPLTEATRQAAAALAELGV